MEFFKRIYISRKNIEKKIKMSGKEKISNKKKNLRIKILVVGFFYLST